MRMCPKCDRAYDESEYFCCQYYYLCNEDDGRKRGHCLG